MVDGSCVLEDNVHVAMYASIRDGVEIGRNSIIGMGLVTKNVPENTIVIGVPDAHLEET